MNYEIWIMNIFYHFSVFSLQSTFNWHILPSHVLFSLQSLVFNLYTHLHSHPWILMTIPVFSLQSSNIGLNWFSVFSLWSSDRNTYISFWSSVFNLTQGRWSHKPCVIVYIINELWNMNYEFLVFSLQSSTRHIHIYILTSWILMRIPVFSLQSSNIGLNWFPSSVFGLQIEKHTSIFSLQSSVFNLTQGRPSQ